RIVPNPGKLGPYRLSPDGSHVAMVSGTDRNDPSPGRLMVAGTTDGEMRDLMPTFDGHVRTIEWVGSSALWFIADVGAETRLGKVELDGTVSTRFESAGIAAPFPVITAMASTADGSSMAFVGQKPTHPGEIYALAGDEQTPRKLTDSNPWLQEVELAPQEVYRFEARDGLKLEGVLIRPLNAQQPAPLILMVHGGPESQDRNGWVTNYSRPGQLAAAEGFAVLYPNYRGSTGRGVEFSKWGHGDAAGKEFDDLIDAIDHLAAAGIVDPERVGVTGGSYGGYATGWLSTRYSERIRGGVMFVGISNKSSKGFTTDIPIEDQWSHTLYEPWTRWEFSLDRSPLFHAEKSRTPLLIAGGTGDTRVHPSQSLQLYRALKMLDNAPVRYVRYPGEPHGNRRAASQDDYCRRVIRWMTHFVRDAGEELPPHDVPYGYPTDDDDDENEDEGETP
ncbi:MAG: S9 family peptidase, partial [Acidobacteriota bacterium]|nr:S9 family peptidase [Acidobacteriota bacterium]